MAVAFSTDGRNVIEQTVEITTFSSADDGSTENIEVLYSLSQCVDWVNVNKFEKVALQIPDELQKDAVAITQWLKSNSSATYFVLADTSYGSCCVDEVAAEHSAADGVIHFGHSCLSPTRRLPVLLVFKRAPLDVTYCCTCMQSTLSDPDTPLVLLYHVMYYHVIGELLEKLKEHYNNVIPSILTLNDNCTIACDSKSISSRLTETGTSENEIADSEHTENHDVTKTPNKPNFTCIKYCGRTIRVTDSTSLENCTVLYIGPTESLTLSTFLLQYKNHFSAVYSYDPLQSSGGCRQEGKSVNRVLARRYTMVEKAKDAHTVGIVVGTLGVADYLQAIDRLKSLIKKAGKKSYLFVMGKLNVAKLANFMEVDIYVLVACSETSLLENTEFYRPVITPFELEIALHPEQGWSGQLCTDYHTLLPGGSSHKTLPEGDMEERHDVSLVTGQVRTLGVSNDRRGQVGDTGGALVAKSDQSQAMLLPGNRGQALCERSWQGLEPQLGKTPVTKAVQGRKGIAIAYEDEANT